MSFAMSLKWLSKPAIRLPYLDSSFPYILGMLSGRGVVTAEVRCGPKLGKPGSKKVPAAAAAASLCYAKHARVSLAYLDKHTHAHPPTHTHTQATHVHNCTSTEACLLLASSYLKPMTWNVWKKHTHMQTRHCAAVCACVCACVVM